MKTLTCLRHGVSIRLTVLHDWHVAEVRFRLQELWDCGWIPEGVFKNKRDQEIVPDGVIVFDSMHRLRERLVIFSWRVIYPEY